MSGAIEVTISPNWDRWIAGLSNVEGEIGKHASDTFKQAGEVFFATTQRNVHVLSGDLLSSGRVETERTSDGITTSVRYGGVPGASGRLVDYAIYEENRGGSHAFMSRSWEQTERLFAQAMPEAWDAVVASWR